MLLVFQNYVGSHIVNVEYFCVYILCNVLLNIGFELIKYSLFIMIVWYIIMYNE